jgi:hypothetical protein
MGKGLIASNPRKGAAGEGCPRGQLEPFFFRLDNSKSSKKNQNQKTNQKI